MSDECTRRTIMSCNNGDVALNLEDGEKQRASYSAIKEMNEDLARLEGLVMAMCPATNIDPLYTLAKETLSKLRRKQAIAMMLLRKGA